MYFPQLAPVLQKLHSPMLENCCPTAQNGGTCTDSTCSKRHDVVRCDPCDCYLPTFSFQGHLRGRKHLWNVASKGLAKPGTLQLAPPSPTSTSNHHSIPPKNTSTRSKAKASEPDVVPPVTMSGEGGSSPQGIAGSLEDHKQIESLGQGSDPDDEPTETTQEAPPQKTIVLPFPPDQRRTRNSRCLPDYELPALIQEAVNNSTATCPYDKKAPGLVSALRPDNLAISSTYVHYFEALVCVEDGHQQCALVFSPFELTGIFG